MGPRRSALRLATDAQHRTLDAFVGPLEDHAAYKSYLLFMTAFRSVLELELNRNFSTHPLQPQLLRSELLLDCQDLQLRPHLPDGAFELSRREEEYLGTLYVLEGSRLGAAVLSSRARALGLTADFGARHLIGLATSTDLWAKFLRYLEDTPGLAVEVLTEGARRAFGLALHIAKDDQYAGIRLSRDM